MKGIVVFDDRSDLAFYSIDKEMEQYVQDRVRQLEGEAGAEVSLNKPKLGRFIYYVDFSRRARTDLITMDTSYCLIQIVLSKMFI